MNDQDGGPANTLTIGLPMAVTAIGFDYMELHGQEDVYTISVGADAYVGLVPSRRRTAQVPA